MINKFDLGEQVKDGLIVGIIHPTNILEDYIKKNRDPSKHDWNKYPNWQNQPVYYIKYLEPKRLLSFEEFKLAYYHIKDEYLEEKYQEIVPKQFTMSVPEQALIDDMCDEIFNEEDND